MVCNMQENYLQNATYSNIHLINLIFFHGVVLRILIYALKSILFGLGAPYVLIVYIHYEIYYKFMRRENFWTFVHCASGILI